MDAAARIVRPGVTTDEIDRVVHEATIAAGTSFVLMSSIFKTFLSACYCIFSKHVILRLENISITVAVEHAASVINIITYSIDIPYFC